MSPLIGVHLPVGGCVKKKLNKSGLISNNWIKVVVSLSDVFLKKLNIFSIFCYMQDDSTCKL